MLTCMSLQTFGGARLALQVMPSVPSAAEVLGFGVLGCDAKVQRLCKVRCSG